MLTAAAEAAGQTDFGIIVTVLGGVFLAGIAAWRQWLGSRKVKRTPTPSDVHGWDRLVDQLQHQNEALADDNGALRTENERLRKILERCHMDHAKCRETVVQLRLRTDHLGT